MSSWRSPSIMTRSSGSVPEYRTRRRPRPASFASTSAMACAAAGMVVQSRFSRTLRLSSTCGYVRRSPARSASERPVSAITLSTLSAVTMPSPV